MATLVHLVRSRAAWRFGGKSRDQNRWVATGSCRVDHRHMDDESWPDDARKGRSERGRNQTRQDMEEARVFSSGTPDHPPCPAQPRSAPAQWHSQPDATEPQLTPQVHRPVDAR
jgi:hypothetical protein